ncbi:MAG: hypothetical protein K2I12_00965 [Duncaniella sp.]|nr:hypothetical protein [Duncaniella sp.]
MEEDDKIRNLFAGFNPDLTPDYEFMSGLQRAIDAVELVKEQNTALKRRSRVAVVIAALTGFVVGVVLTLVMSHMDSLWISLPASFSQYVFGASGVDFSMVTWIVVAGASVLTALNAYEIAMSRLSLGNAAASVASKPRRK